eukprot:CAMPEP_0206609818 /NCGR_PEP_ID=MMETSP0325_2-20121206/54066_1 /ASSEMBLY_ACC=CAM_ASM_000347 /TAXON_ID=2866 /ORGANISM="Crypthecodinium cohnii, Strain Seligo" /LENGTH=110 /DNA_ID=CAMNT_0054128283 /DNA_START=94 /DNA_END=423 /DNA_ORIENTATION=+
MPRAPRSVPELSTKAVLQQSQGPTIALSFIFDWRCESAPFAGLNHQEALEHWCHATKELAAVGPWDSFLLGLTIVRRAVLEEVVPWGEYSRASLLKCLKAVQDHLATGRD